jgi:hypothetical protein
VHGFYNLSTRLHGDVPMDSWHHLTWFEWQEYFDDWSSTSAAVVGRWLKQSSSALWQVLFLILQGDHTPSSLGKPRGVAGWVADGPTMNRWYWVTWLPVAGWPQPDLTYLSTINYGWRCSGSVKPKVVGKLIQQQLKYI